MTTQNGEQNRDLAGRNDVARLVDEFYARLRGDEVLGPIFDDIAQVDWPTHLPRMYDFWDTVLFGTATFRGDPLGVHRTLAQRAPLTKQSSAPPRRSRAVNGPPVN
ncbi:MAG: group III truncated hemoglobin [Vicinamibacterales bacterium]